MATTPSTPAPTPTPTKELIPGNAEANKGLRKEARDKIYPFPNPATAFDAKNDLLFAFSRFAGNQRTTFDNGAGLSAASTSGNTLELKVERAFTQVLGRAVGGLGSTNNFMKALNMAFPVTSDGMVMNTPQRGVISLYSTNGSSNTNGNSVLDGLVGQLSTKQATLYREASLVAGDFLKILAGLETFVPVANKEEVEALRALIRSEISILVEEFGRVDEPRRTRVDAYLTALNSSLGDLKSIGFFVPNQVTILGDKTQTAGFELLTKYEQILQMIWDEFKKTSSSLSEQVERANVLLPIIAQGNIDFQAAMNSVAFTESKQRSRATNFKTYLLNATLKTGWPVVSDTTGSFNIPEPPDIKVRDLVDWLDRFANIEGPIQLAELGKFGLTRVFNEADLLFWTILPIMHILDIPDSNPSTSRVPLRQVLSNERVRWTLDNLLEQLKVLADEAA